jgi:glycosyltransferase involved in cell wall biosynthesis
MTDDGPRPLLSICMPVSRSAEDLRRSLRSVLGQGIDDLEVIVTDDSGGRLGEAVTATDDPRVRYYANPERLGFAGNHMAVLDRARGRYVGILHEDDEYLPGFLRTTLNVFEREREVGVVFTDCWVAHDGVRRRRGVRVRPGRHDRFLPYLLRHDYFLPSTTVFRREAIQASRRWPESQAADLFLFIDVAVAGWPYYYVDDPLVIYHEHGTQISTNDFGLRDSLVQVFSAYSFDEADVEDLRRSRLAWALVSRAGTNVLAGDGAAARSDLRQARTVHGPTLRWKRRALRVASIAPQQVTRLDPVWKRFRRVSGLERRYHYRH